MVMAGAGGVNHEELCKLTNEHFGGINNDYPHEIPLETPCRFTGNDVAKTSIPYIKYQLLPSGQKKS